MYSGHLCVCVSVCERARVYLYIYIVHSASSSRRPRELRVPACLCINRCDESYIPMNMKIYLRCITFVC